jgi:N6-L-threonylcarbamoyladenine synthase
MTILGIETSCDECAAAVVEDGKRVLSNIVASQIEEHRPFYGVVPEIASRKHLEWIVPVVKESLETAGLTMADLDAVAATCRPGLIGALLVGLTFAKGLARGLDRPFITWSVRSNIRS